MTNQKPASFIEKYAANKAFSITSTVAIRPYIQDGVKNMGTEQYDQVLFEGAMQEEDLICLEQNGVRRYVTGLNEFAPEVQNLEDETKEATIRSIRETVAYLEKVLIANQLEISDKDFWKKVVLLRPDNEEFWSKIKIRVSNDPIFLDPKNDPHDLIKIHAIKAGGFHMVAPSFEAATKMVNAPKFFLDDAKSITNTKTEVRKLRNQAGSILEDLYRTNANKLFYIMKVLDPDSTQYVKSTPLDILYDNASRFIDGDYTERDKKKAPKKFIDTSELDMETLKVRALIKDGIFYRELVNKSNGFIYHVKTQTQLGRTPVECAVALQSNGIHDDILTSLLAAVEKYSNI